MDKTTKLLLYIVLGAVLFQGVFTLFFSHSLLKEAVSDIKNVKSDLKNISDSLSSSRKQLSSIMQNLDANQAHIKLMKSQVEVLYMGYHNDETQSKIKRDSLKNELQKQEDYINSLRKDLNELEK